VVILFMIFTGNGTTEAGKVAFDVYYLAISRAAPRSSDIAVGAPLAFQA